ncbi:hypothetical protein LX36DRAFT_651943 [Colletotrichum falcatum]|nr:hypothetical protein LX36DRAFT_651943 [Colletotrichum falcatum]
MTRLGPLTAQALGRSPFDDVVDGEGEADPRAPIQQYDNRGRPVNPETKRMNRDMVRSHNEVMQVIGVAEPDNAPPSAEVDSLRRYFNYEDAVGTRLLRFGRALEIAGVWGINGMRLRILLYKRYADISFFELLQHERKHRSVSSALLTGLPTFLGGHVFKMATYWVYPFPRKNRYINTALSYIRVHLQLYVFLQRLDIIPSRKLFPSLSFFIPGSLSSPIPAPAPPKDFSASSLAQYASAWCVNAIPFVSYVIWGQIWTEVTGHLWQEFYGRLPNTVHHRKPPPLLPPPSAPILETPEPMSDVDRSYPEPLSEIGHENGTEDIPLGVDSPSEPPIQAARRPSSFSARGDDYGSDDEEDGGVSATLISFDVEATDSTDAPPGLWSAELRPSTGPEGSGHGASVQYMDTMLTRLPACLASDIFTVISGYVLVSPYEAVALRLVARSYRERMGLPTFDIHDTNIFSGMTLRGVTNFLGLEFVHLLIAGELWALITGLAQWFHLTEEEWKFFNEIEEAEAAEERRQQEQV